MPAPATTRDTRVDLFRGIALVFMFWDHIPGNVLGNFTLRNFGLSDAAELFVFLSGYGAMLAYGRLLLRDGYLRMAMRVLRRAWFLYVAHVFLLAQLMAVVFIANAQVHTRDFIAEAGLSYFLEEPQRALIAGLWLAFRPLLMDPLPLYICLLVVLPVVLPTLLRRPVWVLVPSFVMYVIAEQLGLNLPSRPEGVWFFNPLAWQFLFLLGGFFARPTVFGTPQVAALGRLRRIAWPVAAAYLLLTLLLTLSWNWPAVHDAVIPQRVSLWLYPINKTDLDPLRLCHFLALALCAARFVRAGVWMDSWLPAGLRLMGQHSLEVFCLSVLLAPLADAVSALSDEALVVQLLTGVGGAVVMWGLAVLLRQYRRMSVPRVASAQ